MLRRVRQHEEMYEQPWARQKRLYCQNDLKASALFLNQVS